MDVIWCSVPNPDPHAFRPPGSRSTSQKDPDPDPYLYHQEKIVRKTLIPTVLCLLLDFLSLKNDVNLPSKVISKKTLFKNWFFVPKCHGSGPEH
jgi:hypothetical protein